MLKMVKAGGFALFLIICLVNSGCATFTASQLPQRSIFSYANRNEQGDLTVAAENFYTRDKCRTYFDTDLTQRYVAPIFFIVSNKGDKEYALEVENFRLTAENIEGELPAMSNDEVGKKVKRGVFWRTLGWCMIVPIISIPVVAIGSGLQTGSVNEKARQDVGTKTLSDGEGVPPNDTIRGVMFFDVRENKIRELIKPRIKAAFVSSDGERMEFDIELSNQ